MKFTPSYFKGFGLAIVINVIVLFLIYLFFENTGSFSFFLSSSWDLKSLVGYLSIASIPVIALFSFMIQRPKADFAQGLLTEIILIVILMAVLKFLI